MNGRHEDGPDTVPSYEDYEIPGYAYLGEPRKPVSYFIPETIQARINGAVRYAGDTGAIPGVQSKTDLLRVATHRYIHAMEQAHNDGQPFAVPAVNNRGRGTDRTEPWVKVNAYFPISLRDRIAGAARFAQDGDLVPDVTSANRLVAVACDAYLHELEREHDKGKPFRDPRRRPTNGRPSR